MLRERWRAAVPVVTAVAVVAALSLLTVTIMSSVGSDDDRAFVDADDDETTTTEATTRRRAPRPTTTTSAAPEVLGETTERDPDEDATPVLPPTEPPSSPPPSPPTTAAAAPPPPPAPTTTTTTTTTVTCRNSTDPSCGAFSWDPEPGPYDVEVYPVSTPERAIAGQPVTFAVDYIDPASPDAQGACLNWWVSDPAVVNTSSCEVIATSCARTGPHDPPEPSRELIPLERTITFETPGEHEVRISGNIGTHLADGCESPYQNSFTHTFTVTVTEA